MLLDLLEPFDASCKMHHVSLIVLKADALVLYEQSERLA